MDESEVVAKLAGLDRATLWHGELASVVESEIIPRLMIAHRAGLSNEKSNIIPDGEQIATFAALILSPASDDIENRITALVEDGLSLDSLLLDLLAPTARHLGVLWEDDLCDFAEMTIAMGRLQRIMHDLTLRYGGETPQHRHGRSILLLPCPGEKHSFGLALIERFFRDAGWDVTSTVRDPSVNPSDRVRGCWFDVIGFSLGCETLLPTLTEAVSDMRRSSQNRAVRVMVGGPIFTANPGYLTQVGADATACDARTAISIAERLLDLPARPC
ncbi:cobalamin B12-binding domain-containing protein [Methylobacterium sp. BTF04]|uniref:cobalamin B12-binding domain-containing protein n=1 Tax=Methylobacterium sp. BTF04 TaxID=2708300 RepID=UPI001FEE7D25|nr:cobalamin B12-binding domain-containing protein [Methylobacterium sp. BTF04]